MGIKLLSSIPSPNKYKKWAKGSFTGSGVFSINGLAFTPKLVMYYLTTGSGSAVKLMCGVANKDKGIGYNSGDEDNVRIGYTTVAYVDNGNCTWSTNGVSNLAGPPVESFAVTYYVFG